MIDIKAFKKAYTEIDRKARKIRVLPMLRKQEQNYVGWEYDKEIDSITIESEFYWQGCSDFDTSYLDIPINEINNSVGWFKQKFQKEIDNVGKKRIILRKLKEK